LQSLVLIFARLMMGGIVPGIGSPAQTKEIRDFLSSIQVGRLRYRLLYGP
jgi:hypothetical protein